jgi:transposase
MMWGAISYGRKTQLVHIPGNLSAARYRDEVLTPHMLPAMTLRRKVFQHDNARPHTTRATVDFLANQNVTVLPWPPKSPDVSPIEHLSNDLNRCVRSRQPALQTLQELQQDFEQEWGEIPQDCIRRLIESMPRRVRAVLQANGGYNRY